MPRLDLLARGRWVPCGYGGAAPTWGAPALVADSAATPPPAPPLACPPRARSAIAVAAFDGAPEELDVTKLDAGSPDAAAVAAAAAKLVAGCNAARAFTDTAKFTLRCGVCALGLVGEKEALLHARATGHQNFAEY